MENFPPQLFTQYIHYEQVKAYPAIIQFTVFCRIFWKFVEFFGSLFNNMYGYYEHSIFFLEFMFDQILLCLKTRYLIKSVKLKILKHQKISSFFPTTNTTTMFKRHHRLHSINIPYRSFFLIALLISCLISFFPTYQILIVRVLYVEMLKKG